jgi:signal transduction histidine kinase
MKTEPIRILLVEDNDGDARLLAEYLREAEAFPTSLIRADRFERARETLAASPPDVILLDLSLPDAHGIGTVTQAIEAAPDVPIIVLTGLDDAELAVQAVHAGAQDYLVKGQVDGPLLARSIRYALERHRLEQERRRALAEEQAARTRAEAAVRARDQVLRVVSHDFDNHLAAIRINATVLLRTLPDSPEGNAARDRVAGMADQVEQLRRLRRDLLDVSALEAGRLSMDPAPIDTGALLADAHEQMAPLAAERGIALALECPRNLPSLNADRMRLLQVLGNLVGNAIKFTPPGGRVTISGETVPDGVLLSVADTGPGIPPEHLPRVFDSFWRQRADSIHGAGLGLGIAKGIVEAHGGRISLESEVGVGSVARVVLGGRG